MRGIERTTGTAIALIVVAVLLSGCGVLAPKPTSTPSGTTRPTASASPMASGTPTPMATSAGPVLSTAGLGSLRMGSPVPDGNGLAAWDPDACVTSDDGGGARAGQPYSGMWKPTVGVTGTSPLGREEPFGLITDGGTQSGSITLLQVWSSQFRTPSGLHVGSTNAAVRGALPTASILDTGQSLEYNVVSGGWRITFTVAESDSSSITDLTPVQLISVYSAAEKELTFWATDGGAFCGV